MHDAFGANSSFFFTENVTTVAESSLAPYSDSNGTDPGLIDERSITY